MEDSYVTAVLYCMKTRASDEHHRVKNEKPLFSCTERENSTHKATDYCCVQQVKKKVSMSVVVRLVMEGLVQR